MSKLRRAEDSFVEKELIRIAADIGGIDEIRKLRAGASPRRERSNPGAVAYTITESNPGVMAEYTEIRQLANKIGWHRKRNPTGHAFWCSTNAPDRRISDLIWKKGRS